MTKTVDIAPLLDESAWSTYQKLLTALAALAIIFDGFDIQILGLALPSLIKDWHVARAAFSPVLAVGLGGMAIGGPLAGYWGDRIGRRPALIGCVVVFGLSTAGTAVIHGLWGLTILRLLTGMGTGGALPNASALTAEFAPLRRRPAAVKLTLICVPLGGMLGSLLAARVLPGLGWRGLYAIGGALPLLFAVVLWVLLPESPRFLARRPEGWPQLARLLVRMGHAVPEGAALQDSMRRPSAERASLSTLFGHEFARDTVGLWVAFLSSLGGVYLIFGWLPTMLTSQGLDGPTASSGLLAYNLGGVFGVLVWAVLVTALGSRRPLLSGTLACAGSALAILLVPVQAHGSHTVLIMALGLNGLLANAVQTSMYALAAYVYPTNIRATGVAYAATIGRIGGLISSLAGAWVIQAGATTFWMTGAITMMAAFAGLVWVRSHFPAMQRK
jgi:AAHS family 4-hydroxybenzoate transporter-like MFS transporter